MTPTSPAQAGVLLMPYGPPKRGKTVLAIRALCGPKVVCIGIRSAIELVAQTVCGFKPPWIEEGVRTLPELLAFLQFLVPHVQSGAAVAVYVDDFSHICSNSMAFWERQKPTDRYWPFRMLDQHLDMVSNAVRVLGIPCVMSAHELPPNPAKNQMGAPEVPSAGQVRSVPSWCDLVARMVPNPASPDPLWPVALWVDPLDEQWVSGDRYNICGRDTPANLREILRASQARYVLPRYPGLEWQDAIADRTAEGFLSGIPSLEILERAVRDSKAPNGSPAELHVIWAVQDGIARAQLYQRQQGGLLARARALDAARALALPPGSSPPGVPAGALPGAPGAPPSPSAPPPSAPSK